MSEIFADILGINRHRINIDGEGIVTLVSFYKCPLSCAYCLNPKCQTSPSKDSRYTPERLINEVFIDNLYFLSTRGGITFGGGEPLLNYRFIEEFKRLANPAWKINIETCLNVPLAYIEPLHNLIDTWIIDIKDMNDNIYNSYSKHSNEQVEINLQYISDNHLQSKCLIRVPLIPNFNTKEDVNNSVIKLKKLGFEKFDKFTYRINPIKSKINSIGIWK